jgi:hypothetical protein
VPNLVAGGSDYLLIARPTYEAEENDVNTEKDNFQKIGVQRQK